MKNIIIFIAVLFFCCIAFAQESEQNVDWGELEVSLYQIMKAEGRKTEAEIHEKIGYALLKADNQWERATVHFKAALELDPSLHYSWYCLGMLDPDTKEGRGYFRKAIEAKPDLAPAYYWLAYSYCRNRMDEEALPIFEKYLELAQGDPNEEGRIRVATEVLQDLYVGKEGKSLSMMRKTFE